MSRFAIASTSTKSPLDAVWLSVCVAAVTLMTDQATKYAVRILLESERTSILHPWDRKFIGVMPGLDLVAVWNVGISYGLFDHKTGQLFLIGFAAAALGLLAFVLLGSTRRTTALSLGLVVGGGVGNLLDRILFGAVFDFIAISVAGFYFPVFNLADVAIVLGIIVLAIDGYFIAGTVHVAPGLRAAASARPRFHPDERT